MPLKRYLLFILLSFAVIFWVSTSDAQEPTGECSGFVEQAIGILSTSCGEMDRNTACYGNELVEASMRPNADVGFEQPGDIVAVDGLLSLTTHPYDEETGTWGLAEMKIQADIPDTVPGQAVTIMLLGDVAIEDAGAGDDISALSGGAFYFSTGLGQPECDGLPPSSLYIHSPEETTITMTINGATIQMASTAVMSAEPNGNMQIGALEGDVRINANGQSSLVPNGFVANVPLGGPDGLQAQGISPDIVPISETRFVSGAGAYHQLSGTTPQFSRSAIHPVGVIASPGDRVHFQYHEYDQYGFPMDYDPSGVTTDVGEGELAGDWIYEPHTEGNGWIYCQRDGHEVSIDIPVFSGGVRETRVFFDSAEWDGSPQTFPVGDTFTAHVELTDTEGHTSWFTPLWDAPGSGVFYTHDAIFFPSASGNYVWHLVRLPGSETGMIPASHLLAHPYLQPDGEILASIDVEITESPLSRIEITPGSPMTEIGMPVLLFARGYNEDGEQVPITPVWSADGGSITGYGAFIADQAGEYTVTATAFGTEVSAGVTVQVVEELPEVPTTCPATIVSNANVRGGPGTGFDVQTTLQAGEQVTVIGVNGAGDWFQIAYGDGEVGWVAGFLLSMSCPEDVELPVSG